MTFGTGRSGGRALYSRRDVMLLRDDSRKALRRAGFAIWAAVGVPVLLYQALSPSGPPRLPTAAWAASYLLFGAAFAAATAPPRRGPDLAGLLVLIAGQTAAV